MAPLSCVSARVYSAAEVCTQIGTASLPGTREGYTSQRGVSYREHRRDLTAARFPARRRADLHNKNGGRHLNLATACSQASVRFSAQVCILHCTENLPT